MMRVCVGVICMVREGVREEGEEERVSPVLIPLPLNPPPPNPLLQPLFLFPHSLHPPPSHNCSEETRKKKKKKKRERDKHRCRVLSVKKTEKVVLVGACMQMKNLQTSECG